MAMQLYSDNNVGFSFNGSSQDLDNICGFNDFCFDLQQQKQQQQQQQSYPQWQNMEQRNQNMWFGNSFLVPKRDNGNNSNQSAEFSQSIAATFENSQSIAATFEKQMQEIGRFITLQNERLRLTLLEERKQQLATLVRKYESKAQILLRQKDEDIAKAVNRTVELEDFLRRMEIESQTWQRLAKENEAMVNSLNNTIQQIKETHCCLPANGVDDAESCCVETGEKRGHEQENEEQGSLTMICKSCNSRNSCFIFLPCRHLCACKDCEVFLDSCPVCGMLKNTSIEALV